MMGPIGSNNPNVPDVTIHYQSIFNKEFGEIIDACGNLTL